MHSTLLGSRPEGAQYITGVCVCVYKTVIRLYVDLKMHRTVKKKIELTNDTNTFVTSHITDLYKWLSQK